MEERFVGIDIGKRVMVVRFLSSEGKLIKKWEGHTNRTGRRQFIKMLSRYDKIGIEASALSFVLAKEIIESTEAAVYVLNPGRLHMIFRSVRKTDSEDALKIARFIYSNPEEALPTVSIPSEQEELCRSIVSEMMFISQSRVRFINRLHSIFVRTGRTDILKSDLKNPKKRTETVNKLNDHFKSEAKRLLMHIDNLEIDIMSLEVKEQELLSGFEEGQYVLSVPGVGLKTALAFLAYVGKGDRFSSGNQVSNYIGMVPRLDISGETVRYGKIHKRGCSTLRALFVQSAWALVRSRSGGELAKKYEELSMRIGKKKAIVAIARKMMELCWTLTVKKELYRHTTVEELQKKLKHYNIQYEGLAA